MNYTIHQLKIFLKVVETRSITKTSIELFMTQPAVSIQLKNFQNQFEIPLTEVVGRQLYVTDFGKEIAQIANRVLSELENIEFKKKEFEGILMGKLKISSVSTGKYIIPYFLNDFLNTYTGIDLELDVTNKSQVIQSLKNNEVDYALLSVLPGQLDLEEEVLMENHLYLMGSKPYREENKPLIYREQGSATRTAMESYFEKNEGKQRKRIELTSNEAVKQAVIAGIGVSIMPLIGSQTELANNKIHIIDAPDLPIISQWRLVWLKGKKLSPVSQEFKKFIKQEKQQILNTHFERITL